MVVLANLETPRNDEKKEDLRDYALRDFYILGRTL